MNVALHMSDGIVNAPTSVLFAAIAAAGVAVAATQARRELDDRTVPMAGLVAAFVFAVQMINFPVLPGVSGHLLGGALAAILVGPWTGALCISIVLVLQAVLFADGGLSAIGPNITNVALVGTAVGYLVALGLRRYAVRGRTELVAVVFVSALVNTIAAAGSFVVQYAVGGDAGIGLVEVTAAMLGVHALIGIGEGLISGLTVSAVARVRPDLVYLLRNAGRPAATPSSDREAVA